MQERQAHVKSKINNMHATLDTTLLPCATTEAPRMASKRAHIVAAFPGLCAPLGQGQRIPAVNSADLGR